MDKLNLRSTGILVLTVGTLLGCKDQNSTNNRKKTETRVIKEEKAIEPETFLIGKWRMDSVAMDRKVTDVLPNTDSTYQGFEFKTDAKVLTIKSNARSQEARPLGSYIVDGDSLFFKNSHNEIYQTYFMERISKDVISLHGNYFITKTVKEKPSFYLSKVKGRW